MKLLPNVAALLMLAVCVASCTQVGSPDKEGCKDVSGVERFQRARIHNCITHNFEAYSFLTGKDVRWDQRENRYLGPGAEAVEGKRNWIGYVTADGDSSEQVYLWYKKQIPASGFRIVYEGKNADLNVDSLRHVLKTRSFGGEEFRYIAAVKENRGVKTYLALLIHDFGSNAFADMDVITVGR